MNAQLDDSFWPWRLAARLIGIFSLLAIVVAAVGLYAVVASRVLRRRREIGLRMALGATPSGILRSTMRDGVRLAIAGLAAGLPLAMAATRVMRSFLYGVGPADAVTYLGVSLLLLATAALACWIPAYRAAKLDPNVALREE